MPSANSESPSKDSGADKEPIISRTHTRPLDLHSSFVRNTFTLSDGQPREFLWSCELTKESPEFTWDFDEEDDDLDYLSHTLFLRHAVVGKGAKEGERHLIEVETKNYAEKEIITPLVRLTPGKDDMVGIDLNFSHEIPVKFRLVEGSGPIHLNGQHLAELPPNDKDEEEDELETEYTEGETATEGDTADSEVENEDEEDEDDDEEDEEEDTSPSKAKKRKGSKQLTSKKSKVRGKLDSQASTASDDDEEDEEDDDDEESMEEDEEESSPEKKKKKGGKGAAATKRPTPKALKAKLKAQPAAPKTKGKKAGKAK